MHGKVRRIYTSNAGLEKNVVEHLSRAYGDTIERNRSIILSIMDVIIALGQRGIPLRGSWKATDKDNKSGFEDSNFNFSLNGSQPMTSC